MADKPDQEPKPTPSPAASEEDSASGGEGAAVKRRKKTAAGEEVPVDPAVPFRLPDFPPRPTSGKRKDMRPWQLECSRIREIHRNFEDPRDKLPTLCNEWDPYTEAALPTPRDKAMARHAGLSIVSISATGQVEPSITQCSGILGSWVDYDGTCSTTILTCSKIVTCCGRLCDPMPKLLIRLANKTALEGELLFFNDYYKIALLKISTEISSAGPFLGSSHKISSPNYGDEIFMLSREENGSLMARHGSILRLEKVGHLESNHCMIPSCSPPMTGGAVIDCDGNLKGMAFQLDPAILSISTICRCTQMWASYSRIARPVLGLSLKTVELLSISLHDDITLDHGISGGYIVSSKHMDESCGVARGDIILSFGRMDVHTLPQLEDFLLDLGLNFLKTGRRIDTDVVDLKLPVYDPMTRMRSVITYPLRFSDACTDRICAAQQCSIPPRRRRDNGW